MLFFIAVSVLLASANARLYTDCGSKLATVSSVGVSSCKGTEKECIFKRGTNATITIDFTPSVDVTAIVTDVHGVVMNMPLPFPVPQNDACKESGLTCPLTAGQVANYVTTLPVLKSYPELKVQVKWELKTEDGEDLVCVLIPGRIK